MQYVSVCASWSTSCWEVWQKMPRLTTTYLITSTKPCWSVSLTSSRMWGFRLLWPWPVCSSHKILNAPPLRVCFLPSSPVFFSASFFFFFAENHVNAKVFMIFFQQQQTKSWEPEGGIFLTRHTVLLTSWPCILIMSLISRCFFVVVWLCMYFLCINKSSDSVFSAYMLILDNDTNAEVRRAVLSCIAMSPWTLPKVLKRTRDIKANVRKLAYQVATYDVTLICRNICQVYQRQHSWFALTFLSLFSVLRFWLKRFTLKLWPLRRELVSCRRVFVTPQVMCMHMCAWLLLLHWLNFWAVAVSLSFK